MQGETWSPRRAMEGELARLDPAEVFVVKDSLAKEVVHRVGWRVREGKCGEWRGMVRLKGDGKDTWRLVVFGNITSWRLETFGHPVTANSGYQAHLLYQLLETECTLDYHARQVKVHATRAEELESRLDMLAKTGGRIG